ncbi:hypothetical protein V5O48_013255 [Marasmius crinis-equi]|uniref:Uncharacterized protein n=1 Tax=Marasmius crinis-equi TaxID=585013 RepID=A0ABR3F0K8_9AGAR
MDFDNGANLSRAVALSLRESKKPSPDMVIDDEDEELRRVIEASKAEAQNARTQQSSSSSSVNSPAMSSLSPPPQSTDQVIHSADTKSFISERAQMERERLKRFRRAKGPPEESDEAKGKRKRDADDEDEEEDEIQIVDSVPPIKKQRVRTLLEWRRRKEKASRRRSEESEKQSKRKSDRESRRASEERKRTASPSSDVFPEVYARRTSVSSTGRVPLVTLEEATSDGHGRSDDDRSIETPSKRARSRLISEQLLKSRPRAIHEDDGDGVLSILSAATNDLEKLINHLDLEATPGVTPGTPESFHWRPPRQEEPVPKLPCEDSPTKKTLRKDITSISSLRPYAQLRTNNAFKSATVSQAGLIGQ